MASGKSLEKAEELVNKLFYVPAYTADDLESRDDNDERVIIIATALDEARSEAIEEAAKVADGCCRCVHVYSEHEILNTAEAIRKLKEKP